MIAHGVIFVSIILFATIFYYEIIYHIWLCINLIIGTLYTAIGATIIILNDDDQKCQYTGIGLILSGTLQTIGCATLLVIKHMKKNESLNNINTEQDTNNQELMDIIQNPTKYFNENSVVRDTNGSLLSINSK